MPGESVEYIPNPHWHREAPLVEKIIAKTISPDTVSEALKAGKIDLVSGLPAANIESFKDLNNIELLSSVENSYGYIGFKLGKWNADSKEVEMDDTKKVADVQLRKAIAYAMDNEQIAEVFYNDLRIPANSLIDPAHTFWNNMLPGYKYNPEKAMEILDEAGYVDVDGDGFREDKDGNKFQLNFLSMSGGDIAEPLAQFYIQNWNDIGLDVVLQDGRLVEMNAFYDMVGEDNPNIDLYMGAWSVGSNPDPSGLYGRASMFNYPRYASEANDAALAKIASPEAFGEDGGMDEEFLQAAYDEWQELMYEELPVAPTHFRVGLAAINKRVNYYDTVVGPENEWDWNLIGLLSDTPEEHK